MENYLKKLLRVIAKLVVYPLHPYIIKMTKSIINYLTTEYIVKQLKKSGSNPIICFPISTLGLNYIEIGNNFRARPYLRIKAYDKHLSNQYAPKIIIGDNVSIDFNCHIGCINQVCIGNNVLIPHKDGTFDHNRPTTSLEHLVDDYSNDTTEEDLTHMDEILKLHDLKLDPEAGSREEFLERSKNNFLNRCFHHHVFTTMLVFKLMDYLKLKIKVIEVISPNHILVIAQKLEKNSTFDNNNISPFRY